MRPSCYDDFKIYGIFVGCVLQQIGSKFFPSPLPTLYVPIYKGDTGE